MLRDSEKFNQNIKPNSAFLNELEEKLPELSTKDDNFDLDKLRDELRKKNINELNERYQLSFIGKNYARRQTGEMPTNVVISDEEQSSGESRNSKNLFFTGGNLEMLRHLQSAYANKVDVIYIDPPCSTEQNDFAYPDNSEYADDQLEDISGLDENQLARLRSIQEKSSHSVWLTFMYPRLQLSKHLLKQDGVIFISIDDNEDGNLKEICDEIFGESNFLAQVVWKRTYAPINLEKNFSPSHGYILVYGRDANIIETNGISRSDEPDSRYNNPDNDSKGPWNSNDISAGPAIQKNICPIAALSERVVEPPAGRSWRLSQKAFRERLTDNRIWFGADDSGVPQMRRFKSKLRKTGIIPMTIRKYQEVSHSQGTTQYLQSLMGGEKYFAYPKLVKLIRRAIQLYSNENSVIVDFFAGSATTAEAVMQQNIEDGGNCKFTMIQLPERVYEINDDGAPKLGKHGDYIPTKDGRAAYEDGYRSIDQIPHERIRRTAGKIKEDNGLTLPESFNGSFKHYRVVRPTKRTLENIDDFDPNNINLLTNMIEGFSSDSLNIPSNASGRQTVLTTWLVQDGHSSGTSIQDVKFNDYTAYMVDNRLYLITEGWSADETRELLNRLGTHQLDLQNVMIFGYPFNIAELRELENGLKQLGSRIDLIRRY